MPSRRVLRGWKPGGRVSGCLLITGGRRSRSGRRARPSGCRRAWRRGGHAAGGRSVSTTMWAAGLFTPGWPVVRAIASATRAFKNPRAAAARRRQRALRSMAARAGEKASPAPCERADRRRSLHGTPRGLARDGPVAMAMASGAPVAFGRRRGVSGQGLRPKVSGSSATAESAASEAFGVEGVAEAQGTADAHVPPAGVPHVPSSGR